MNIENVKKWTTALRSGEFTQGQGLMRRVHEGQTYDCCLSVGCIVQGLEPIPATNEDSPIYPKHPGIAYGYAGGFRANLPPDSLRKWLGLATEDSTRDVIVDLPDLPTQDGLFLDGLDGCAELNDAVGLTFEQIADLVDYFGVK